MNRKKPPVKKTQASDDIVFADGISVFDPHPNAPDWVHADVSIDMRRLVDFIRENPKILSSYRDGQGKQHKCLRLQLLESTAGNLYMKINDYQPEERKSTRREVSKGKKKEYKNPEDITEPEDDLPF